MKRNITYKWGADNLLIELGNGIEMRSRFLYWGEFLITMGMATILLLRSLPLSASLWNTLTASFAACLYCIAVHRFLLRMFSRERILLKEDSITIFKNTPFSIKAETYYWNNISPLYYAGKTEKTTHPLKGHSFDYLGLDTNEYFLQRLHSDGNLYFMSSGYPIHFAKGVYSWHAEEMVYMMQLFAGNRLRLGPEWKQILKSHQVDEE